MASTTRHASLHQREESEWSRYRPAAWQGQTSEKKGLIRACLVRIYLLNRSEHDSRGFPDGFGAVGTGLVAILHGSPPNRNFRVKRSSSLHGQRDGSGGLY